MESCTIGDTGQALASATSEAMRGRTIAHILMAYLKQEAIKEEEARLIEQSCASPFALVVIRLAARRAQLDQRDVNEILNGIHVRHVVIPYEDSIVALVSYADARVFAESFVEKSKVGKISAVISLPFEEASAICQQYDLVKYSLNNLDHEGVHNAEGDALSYLVNEISSKMSVDSLLHPALAKLANYDEANQSNLLNTLKVYLDQDRNAQRCANLLYLHRNSLQYRVRRIQEIADINLDDPVDRAYLRLSFLLS